MIDPATQYLVATEVVMDWDLTDLAAVAAIAGEEFALDSDELPSFVVSATTRYTEIGEPRQRRCTGDGHHPRFRGHCGAD